MNKECSKCKNIIDLNGLSWRIEKVPKDNTELNDGVEKDGGERLGLTVYKPQIIYISDDQTKEATRMTLVHELVHATLYSFGYSYDMNEEELCNFIGAQFGRFSQIINQMERYWIEEELKEDL